MKVEGESIDRRWNPYLIGDFLPKSTLNGGCCVQWKHLILC